MTLLPNDDQRELVTGLRRFLSAHWSLERLRDGTAPEAERTLLRRLGSELDLLGLGTDTERGGSGGTFVEQALVLQELGRHLACAAYLSSAVVVPAVLAASGDTQLQAELLPLLAAGSRTAALALPPAGSPVQVERQPHGFALSGLIPFVLDGGIADTFLVAAPFGDRWSLFCVEIETPGVHRAPLATLDLSRTQAALGLDRATARLVGSEGAAAPWLEHARCLATVGIAMEQVGGAERCLEMSVAYAKTRMQFGRPIGSFQAIKHKCADMLVAMECARAAAYDAVDRAMIHPQELREAAALAKAVCSDAFVLVATENIQIHGGIGFTWQHEAHLHYRRAHASALALGDAVHHREDMVQLLTASRS